LRKKGIVGKGTRTSSGTLKNLKTRFADDGGKGVVALYKFIFRDWYSGRRYGRRQGRAGKNREMKMSAMVVDVAV
jgi:hypothetical protein